MGQTLTISDALNVRLEASARAHGLRDIVELLELWQGREDELRQRQGVVAQINALRERLLTTYGEFPDSTELIREDRGR